MITCIFENGKKASLRHVVVDTIIVKNSRILMVKRAPQFLEGNKWGLVGGFVNRDETLVQAVYRETMEETGYKIESLELFRIVDNPKRPKEDRQNIVFVYTATPAAKVSKADSESTDIRWFSLHNLPGPEETAFDHYQQIQLYLKHLKKPYSLPLFSR